MDFQSQILERVQPDRVTVTKPEEDRRRRTIIVEKKSGSYGFTLQSYGIHYKKEQEIEMITYVDYVEYDGPAFRSGMREGDVILSINGTDMEKADHKTLVNFIKNCDTRMRMVVLFEDCVRKVELHMRYIQLQRILQSKMTELEKLCIRERQLLEGKWKTHSLPARKKASQQSSTNGDPPTPTQTNYTYCRPTVSTEDVAKVQQKQPINPPLIFAYQYLDPHYRYMLQPSTTSSGEYLLTFDHRYADQQPHFVVKTPCDPAQNKQQPRTNNHPGHTQSMENKTKKTHTAYQRYAGHLCNPCLQSNNSTAGDNTSLEAYDLASPCCDPHCVPTSRRRPENHHRKRDSKTEETQTDPQVAATRSRPHSQQIQTQNLMQQTFSVPRRYFHHFGAGLVSQCSLHSCTSSELSCVAPTTMGESSGSYTTSLSTDTLYWDGSCDMTGSRQLSVKSSGGKTRYAAPQGTEPVYVQYPQVKPKSWDNLTTKTIGGYGFGYGYFDTGSSTKSSRSSQTGGKTYSRVDKQTSTNSSPPQLQYTPHSNRRYFQTNKSTESLLSVPKYSSETLCESNNSCECLTVSSPLPASCEARFFPSPRQSVNVSPTDPNFGYYSAAGGSSSRRSSKCDCPKNVSVSEATRL